VLGVISSSPDDLQPVFQTMLQNDAVRICDAKAGNKSHPIITINAGRYYQTVGTHF